MGRVASAPLLPVRGVLTIENWFGFAASSVRYHLNSVQVCYCVVIVLSKLIIDSQRQDYRTVRRQSRPSFERSDQG